MYRFKVKIYFKLKYLSHSHIAKLNFPKRSSYIFIQFSFVINLLFVFVYSIEDGKINGKEARDGPI